MKKYCLAVDLVDDAALIAEYEAWHQKVPDEIQKSIRDAGITNMEIYRVENRMFMIMETTDDFSFDAKAAADLVNPKVQEWENLMWKYQASLPFAKPGEKWVLMKKIFQL
ncbi:MAG TPA: L-rhamnose mutarotase [Flavitalea sp.]|nr:L-rhamnose mutarotase [Flavitalea sp.]